MSAEGINDKESGLPFHEPSLTPQSSKLIHQHVFRTELTAFIGEFIGTFMFLALAFCGTQIAIDSSKQTQELNADELTGPNVNKLLYIAFSFGISLAINVAIFADVSGGKFNPAVSFALFITRKITWYRMVSAIFSQMLAGMAASGFVAAIFPGPLGVSTALDPSISIVRGLFLEAFVTSMLILTILMLDGGPAKPMYIGMALFVAELCSAFYTGGSLNPARSFGPCVVVGFSGYHWIYWLGPLLGSAVASGAYWVIHTVRPERKA